MTDWVDDFTHDYFADATYTVLGGTEGSSYTVGGGQLSAAFVEWEDARTAAPLPATITIDLLDIATLAFFEFGFIDSTFGQGAVAVINPGSPYNLAIEYVVGSSLGGASINLAESSGPIEVAFQMEHDKVVGSVGAEIVTQPIASGDQAAFAALSLVPFVGMAGSPALVATLFKHTLGGAPPVTLTPGVRAGLQSSGLVPLHPLA